MFQYMYILVAMDYAKTICVRSINETPLLDVRFSYSNEVREIGHIWSQNRIVSELYLMQFSITITGVANGPSKIVGFETLPSNLRILQSRF